MEICNIPLTQNPNQKFTVEIDGKTCEFEILFRYGYTIMNLTVDDEVQFNGFVCHNNQNILLYNHLKLNGDLRFIDTQGSNDPVYTGFNERYFLVYVF